MSERGPMEMGSGRRCWAIGRKSEFDGWDLTGLVLPIMITKILDCNRE